MGVHKYIPCTDISVILVCSFRRMRLADWTSACTTTVAASCEGAGAEGSSSERRHKWDQSSHRWGAFRELG